MLHHTPSTQKKKKIVSNTSHLSLSFYIKHLSVCWIYEVSLRIALQITRTEKNSLNVHWLSGNELMNVPLLRIL